VENKNRHVVAYIRTICAGTPIPHNMWQDLCTTYAYLHSITPRPHMSYITPYQHLCGNPPDVSHIRAVGSLCSLHDARPTIGAFDDRGIPCVLLGFDDFSSSTYIVMKLHNHEVVRSRHIIFNENMEGDIPTLLVDSDTSTPQLKKARTNSPSEDRSKTDAYLFEKEYLSQMGGGGTLCLLMMTPLQYILTLAVVST
jgi:hypothetical protein